MTKKTKKRFYRAEEIIWVHEKKVEGKVVSLDIPNQNVVVEIDGKEETLKLWEIDKLKYKAKDKFFKENPDKIKKKKKYTPVIAKGELMLDSNPKVQLMMPVIDQKTEMNNFGNHVSLSKAFEKMYKELNAIMNPEVFFARIHPDAVVPTKRDEDAGYDLYACVDERDLPSFDSSYEGRKKGQWIYCKANETTLVSTGLAFALPKTHYLNAKHERGSTGKISMSVLAGVIDSGYRGEVFLAITPLHKDVVITSQVDKTIEDSERIYYPYSKAIAQATVDLVPNTKLTELTLKELLEIESERGDTKLGQSGK